MRLCSYWNELGQNLSRWNVIAGLVLAVLAVAWFFCCAPFFLRRKWEEAKRGKAILISKLTALGLLIVAAVLVFVRFG